MLNPLNVPRWGTDPEGFFQKGGAIIGSERLIPLGGIRTYTGKVVRDGVQFELNPVSASSVSKLARNISGLFAAIQKRLAQNPSVSICFDGLVEVSEKELKSLSVASRRLGCMGSFNVYGAKPIDVDPEVYRKRSAGGHLHVGSTDKKFMAERASAVYAFDIIVGNTLVMFDRDPGAVERRENYGRAGEYRTPPHGLEYRTTSNFWLRDYALMDLTFGLAHIAYDLSFQSFNGNKALWDDLASRVNIKRIEQAINTNDAELALKNFKKIVPLLRKQLPKTGGFVLTPKNIDLVVGLGESGAEKYFPEKDIVTNWINGKQETFQQLLERLV